MCCVAIERDVLTAYARLSEVIHSSLKPLVGVANHKGFSGLGPQDNIRLKR